MTETTAGLEEGVLAQRDPLPGDHVVGAGERIRVLLGEDLAKLLLVDRAGMEKRGPDEDVQESELLGIDRGLVRPDRVVQTRRRLEGNVRHPTRGDEGRRLVDGRMRVGRHPARPDLGATIETSDRRVSIERIAREAGVEQIVYVEVKGFALTLDGFTPRPTAVANIKVLDVAANTKVFPGGGNPGGREVVAQVREVDPSNYESFAKRRRVEDDLAFKMGVTVAELFYEHQRVDLGENLGIR